MIPTLMIIVLFVFKVTSAGHCGGVQNKYVCHPSNPTIFQICIGEQMYTMRCPGGLHFNSRTQTCDWPKNAFCGTLRQPKSPSSLPQLKTRNPYLPPFQSKSSINSLASKTKRRRPAATKTKTKSRLNSVAAATGPKQPKNQSVYKKNNSRIRTYRRKDRSRYTVKQHRSKTTKSPVNLTVPTKSKWTLAHYPWWAAKSPATRPTEFAASSDQSKPKPTTLPAKSSNVADNAPMRPGIDIAKYTPRKPDLNNAPRAPNSVANRGPPKKRKHPVPATTQQPLTTKFKPTKTGRCDASNCKLPDCRCAGTNIPANLTMKQTPMMIMVTFDDSVNIGNNDYYLKLFNNKRKNPNDCPHRGTFFVSGDATQYHYVRDLYKKGNEIASHSISHRSPTTWWAQAGYDGYVKEIEGMSKRLAREGKVPKKQIKGMRVPFLQVGGDGQYQMLEDYGYLWDSSMVTGALFRNTNPSLWPFTLDYAPNTQHCSLAPCPMKSYPGLWEVPLVRWYGNNKMACAMPDGCTVGPGRKGTLEYLMDNFHRQYNANKAPLGIFLHASWFRRKSGNLEGLIDFLEKMTQLPDVYVLTVSQVIDWIRHPKPLAKISELQSWKC